MDRARSGAGAAARRRVHAPSPAARSPRPASWMPARSAGNVVGPTQRDGSGARGAVDCGRGHANRQRHVVGDRAGQRGQRNALPAVHGSIRPPLTLARVPRPWLPGRGRHDLIHQTPVHRAFATHAFLGRCRTRRHRSRRTRRLSVSRVRPPVPGQHRQQRQLRQRHGGAAVVDQHDVVGRHRELVAAARRRAAIAAM